MFHFFRSYLTIEYGISGLKKNKEKHEISNDLLLVH